MAIELHKLQNRMLGVQNSMLQTTTTMFLLNTVAILTRLSAASLVHANEVTAHLRGAFQFTFLNISGAVIMLARGQ
jgi:hypothetical protein